MIVYYAADKEKSEKTDNVKFFTDHSSALAYAKENRRSVYQFEVNDKCETGSFGMDTIMVFNKNPETGELKFLGSGRWLELHEIMNIPFYYDFEDRSKSFVSMSLQYFNQHYMIVDRNIKEQNKKQEKCLVQENMKNYIKTESVQEKPEKQNIDDDIINELFC